MSIWVWETFTITDKHGQKRVSPRLTLIDILTIESSISKGAVSLNSKYAEQGKYIESSKRETPSHLSSRPVRMTEYYLTENLKTKSV